MPQDYFLVAKEVTLAALEILTWDYTPFYVDSFILYYHGEKKGK